MAFLCKGILSKIQLGAYNNSVDESYDGKQSAFEDSSSEDESETPVLPLLESIEKRKELAVIQKYITKDHIKSIDYAKNSCLHIAVRVFPCNLTIIKELLNHGAEINRMNWKDNTPLHSVAENSSSNVDLVQVLLDYGAIPNAMNKYKDTPLHLFVEKCLREPKNRENFEIIKLLLKNGANPSLRNSVHVNPFLLAVHPPYCHLSAYVGLVKYGADFSVTWSNESMLDKPLLPTSSRSLDMIKLFLQYQPSLIKYRDNRHRSPLHIAVFGGASVNIVMELISKGADVNAKDESGNTPLHQTTLASYSVIEALVKYGAEVNIVNEYGRTPLHEAVDHRLNLVNSTAIRALVELGADVEMMDFDHKTPLTYALLNESIPPDIIRLLLERLAHTRKTCFSYPFYRINSIQQGYNFSKNNDTDMICIQFMLLYLFITKEWNKIPIFRKLIIIYNESGKLGEFLAKYQYDCLVELFIMKRDELDKNVFLLTYVWENIFGQKDEYQYPPSVLKNVICRIHKNKYPKCRDLMYSCIKRNALMGFLRNLVIFTCTRDDFNKEHIMILEACCVSNLAKFLNKDTMLNLAIAFSKDYCFYNDKNQGKKLTFITTPLRRKDESTLIVRNSKRSRHEQ